MMKMDVDMFPVNVVELGQRKVLVQTDQAATTKGKNVIIFEYLRNWMAKPRNLEGGVWKENTPRKPARRVKPTSSMLIKKYKRQQQVKEQLRWRGFKRERSPGLGGRMMRTNYFRCLDYRWRSTQGYGMHAKFEPARVVHGAHNGGHRSWSNMGNTRGRKSEAIVLYSGERS
jgi:hypothetical protein